MSYSKLSILALLTVLLSGCVTLTPEDRLVNAKRSIKLGNYQRAIIHLEPLLDAGNTEAKYLLGVVAFETKQNDHARDIFLPLAESGYEPAYMQLAETYKRLGQLDDTVVWLKKAVESGHEPAYIKLAETYRRLEQFEDAAVWLKKAAEAGISEAQFQLAQTYWYGLGVNKDRAVTFAIIDTAHESPQTREEAAGWREFFEFIVEMEEGPQEIVDGSCIVYINNPYLSAGIRDRTSKAWCDKRLDSAVGNNAIEAVKIYLKENSFSTFDYQLKAKYVQKSTGIRISGLFNKSRGSSKALIEYETGPGAMSAFLRGLSADSTDQPSRPSSSTNELVDLMIDPRFLLNPAFSREKVSVDGIKLGDLEHAIPRDRVKKQKTEGDWRHLDSGARFRLKDGVIVEIGIPKSRTKTLQIPSEADVVRMFGKPDRVERVTAGSIVLLRQYQYLTRGLLVNWADRLGGLAHITVFSKGVCAGLSCP